MALRLRRGTDAERLTITPLEGELVYTTDTKELFIGDGAAVGGNPVITNELADLTDVDLTGLADGQTIVYNLSNTRFEPGTVSTAIDDLTDVDTTGIVAGNILKWDGASFIPSNEGGLTQGATYNINIDGDLTGSVFADDSSVLVDGVAGQIVGQINTSDAITISVDGENISLLEAFTSTTGGANDIIANSHRGTIDSPTNITMGDGVVDLVARGFQGTTYHPATFIRFRSDNDGVPSGDMDDAAVGIPGSILFTVFDNSGVQNLPGTFELNQTGLLVGSSSNPNNDQLRVGGNISSSGTITPGIYADAAARDAAITSPTAGMMVFVTDIAKFQGYTGSAWADLN